MFSRIKARLRRPDADVFYMVLFLVLIVGGFLFIRSQSVAIFLLFINPDYRAQVIATLTTYAADFLTLTLSILVEALPFVVLGVLFSVLIQVFVPAKAITSRLPKNRFLRRLVISCLGILMPVCECGNVPVARGLIAKGFTPKEAVVFLLSAPSVNIITFVVTWQVFSNHSVAIVRVLATIVIANIVASFALRARSTKELLTPEFTAYCAKTHKHTSLKGTIGRATSLFSSEMWLILRLLVFGALIAAASQVFIPREFITAIGSNVALSVLAMLILSFVISICSSVDAFFALAYVNMFGLGPILAFLIAGPMVDIKMISLLRSTFTVRPIVRMTLAILVLSFIVGLAGSYVW